MSENRPAKTAVGILVLRPVDQAKETIHRIELQGWQAVHFPAIEIKAVDTWKKAGILENLQEYDWIIFISQNAVKYFITQTHHRPEGMPKIATVGRATTAALQNAGYHVAIQPDQDFSSEGLLNTADFQQVTNQQVLIVRGNGGRELLAETLTSRGAIVTYAEVYERLLPESDTSWLVNIWNSTISVILATSNQLLDNLVVMLSASLKDRLYEKPLVVISQRMFDHARQLGFKKIWLADGPTNDQMIAAIQKNMVSK